MVNPICPMVDLGTKESCGSCEWGEKMSRDGLNEQPFMRNARRMVFQGIVVMPATAER
jgi:hypothetical protein